MPSFGQTQTPDYSQVAQTRTTAPDTEYGAAYDKGLDSNFSIAAAFIGGATVDLADTISSSIGLTDRDQLNDNFLAAVGSPGLTGWYNDNRGAIEVGSAIGGIILSDAIARKALKPAGKLMQSIRGVPYAGRLATLDAQRSRAVRLATIVTRQQSQRAAMGIETFAATELRLPSLGAAPLVTSARAASRGVFRATAAQGVARYAGTEAVMATVLNENRFLYTDDLAHNIAWSVAGLGVTGAIESMVASYTLRKIANSDVTRRLNSKSLDVSGLEAQRIHASSIVDSLLRAGDAKAPTDAWRFAGSEASTDKVTSLAVAAAELAKPRGITDRARALFGKREITATPTLTMAFEEMNKVTIRGFQGVAGSGFGTKLEGLGAPIKESITREPGSMFGINEIATTVDNLTRAETVAMRDIAISKRLTQVQKLLTDGGKLKRTTRNTKEGKVFVDELVPLKPEEKVALLEESTRLQYSASGTPVTMLFPGEWSPIALGKIADDYQPGKVVSEGGFGVDNVKIWSRERTKKGDPVLGIGSDLNIYLPGNGKIETLKIQDMLSLYHIGATAVKQMQAAGHVMVLPVKPNWFQLDLAEQLIKASGGDESLVNFGGKLTRQSAQVESFAQKVEALRRREAAMNMATRRGVPEVMTEAKVFEQKIFFNLPRITSYQMGLMQTSETPLDLILSGVKSGKEVRGLSHAELLKMLNDAKRVTQFTDETVDNFDELAGDSFKFLLDRDLNPIKPIVAIKRPMAPTDWTRDELFMRQIMTAAKLRDDLTGVASDPITREIVNAITSNPNFLEARKVLELADNQSRSMVPGFRNAAPQTPAGSLINALTSRQRRDIDNLTMLAASKLKDVQTRITNDLMKNMIRNTMGDTITQVNSPRNVATKVLLDQFHSFRPGWELVSKPVPVTLPDGRPGFQFLLDPDSKTNKAWFKQYFDKELVKGQPMLSPNGTEIVLDELGMDVVTRMQKVHSAQRAMKNTLLRSQGLPEIREVPWYAHPANDKGKFVAYVFDFQDNVIPGRKIVANSPEGLAKAIADAQKDLKPGYTIRQRTAVQSFMTLWDKAQMDFIAPNVTAIQPKKINAGAANEALLNSSAFRNSLETMQDNMSRHGNDILELLFAAPLQSARVRSSLSRISSGLGEDSVQYSGMFERYAQNLLGKQALNAKDSFFGVFANSAEARLNGLLASPGALSMGDTFQAFKDFVRTASPKNKIEGEKFDKLAKSLGKYLPYKDAAEMAARQSGTRTPLEIAGISEKLSWFEAASRLRWGESMHAVVNFASILANSASVIKSLQPFANETIEEAAKRTGNIAMRFATPDGKAFNVLNSNKLVWQAFKDAWKAAPSEFRTRALKLGFLDQEVAELSEAMAAIKSRDGWRGFVFGNPSADFGTKTGLGVRNKIAKSGGLDKWLGILSDKSEAFTRQWGMYLGKRVAEMQGIKNVGDQLDFAHDMTNKIVANYDPRNRPEVFQGPLGAPIGLFQSYVFNYYERMFRYIETGNTRALATQYAMQGAMFGADSLPGWSALNWAFFDNQQGEADDPVDSLYRRFGEQEGDLLMHGVLSNLPKLFGAEGVSLYTRGDSTFRVPANPIGALTDSVGITSGDQGGNLPVFDTMRRLVKGIQAGFNQLASQGSIAPAHASEIMSNVITNRPLAGLIELTGANGFDTTWDGQVVSQARTGTEQAYRLVGIRSMQQQKEIEAFYQNRNAQEEQAARQSALRGAARSAIRDGRYDEVPLLFQDYVKSGGSPDYYTRWRKDMIESSLDTRGQRMLDDAMRRESEGPNAIIGRLLDAGTDPLDESEGDYGAKQQAEEEIARNWELTPEPTPTQEPAPGF
jgi:hypothetical protein